jgi:hypothetical protein
MTRILKEPLIHFLVLGGGLFLWFDLIGGEDELPPPDGDPQDELASRPDSKEIVVSKGQIENLRSQFSKTRQRPPSELELKGLIDAYVREEVMYRQALKLGLDRDDTIVRRRMQQKLEFFTEDLAALATPSDDELQNFLESNLERYRLDPKLTFKQVYLDPQRRADTIEADIESLLATLSAAGASADISEAGDRSLLEQEFEATGLYDVERTFGSEFSQGLLEVETGSWQGPVKSGFGLHLVYISERIDARPPSLDEVRAAVERDWSATRRDETNEAIYNEWLSGYKVTIEEIDSGAEGDR